MLRYGAGSAIDLKPRAEIEVIECGTPRGVSVQDCAAAVQKAIGAPLEFPPLARSVVPGDHVAIALESCSPQIVKAIPPVVEVLQKADIAIEDISIVCASNIQDDQLEALEGALKNSKLDGVTVTRHDPADRKQMSYVAATEAGRAVYLGRAIADAEFVVSIGEAFADDRARSVLYPRFSDQDSINRSQGAAPNDRARKELAAEGEQIAWLLGVQFAIRIVPGENASVLQVVAGEATAVIEYSRRLCRESWTFETPRRADLVIAAIGGEEAQTWSNVARALATARSIVRENGVIALCTELNQVPDQSLSRAMAGAESSGRRRGSRARGSDARVVEELAETTAFAKVYLLSRLDDDVVEELGFVPVAAPEEIERLAKGRERCILLANAHLAVGTAAED